MEWFLWALAVVVLGLAAVVGSGRFGSLPPAVRDAPRPHLPDRGLAGEDLRRVQFEVVTRGYSMAQVDEVLDLLALQLDAARPAAPPPESMSAGSAIMDTDEIHDATERENDGSNEATHG